ncbi:helix-turn-helix transcriptional regulator [Glycomyces luteolus]|uniref:Helix-turn-helix transcriptional regulator n=1 Tax=Glycomyces luteolus TaxID=2670330 RepID=A0A9X3P6J5_9ACTN|nr:helix-turn-helix transcriptional regulator [Glycomyces luteolus]MDA1359748.1 helix-turn-helix transcriptional regulator [Glycomyces luteolus]
MEPRDIARMKADLGLMLADLRDAKGWTQQQLIVEGRVRTSRSTVANTETGRQFPDENFWSECDDALDAEGSLLAAYRQVFEAVQDQKRSEATAARQRLEEQRQSWSEPTKTAIRLDLTGGDIAGGAAASTSHTVPRDAWDQPSRNQLKIGSLRPPHRLQGSQLDAAIEHLADLWHTLVRTDNLFGPRHALESVHQQLSILDSLLEYAQGVQRQEVLKLGSRYAESAAWLHEDTANMRRAENWTRQALEWATEAGDQAMVSWAMFRRSQQATTRRNAAQTISLSKAAQRNEERLADPARAAIQQQEAQGYALEGNERECHKRLDDAHEFAASPDTKRDGRTGHGDFCTPTYIEVQRAKCWLTLGRPELAVPIFEHAVAQVPDVYHRDRGQAQVLLARAYAGVGQYDAAAARVASALQIARGSGSSRMLIDAVALARVIAAECDSPAVSGLLTAVDELNE